MTASQQEIALEQFREEEKQRVFGVIPNFYVICVPNAPPLTSKQKFELALKTSIDPVTFLVTGAFTGIEQATILSTDTGKTPRAMPSDMLPIMLTPSSVR